MIVSQTIQCDYPGCSAVVISLGPNHQLKDYGWSVVYVGLTKHVCKEHNQLSYQNLQRAFKIEVNFSEDTVTGP